MQIKVHDLGSKLAGTLAPCYLVSGDEPLLVQEACDLILAAASGAGFDERTLIHADTGYRWNDLLQDAASMSLFASQRVLDLRVAGNKFDREASEVLRAFADAPPADTVLLIRSARLEGRQRQSAWYKALDKIGVLVPIYAVSPAEMPRWLRARLQQANLRLEPEALRYLSERLEGNLLAAVQEIAKLSLLELSSPITLEALLDATEDAASYGVFDLIDAMLAGESARVVRSLSSLQAEGIAVFPILGALGAQLRNLRSGNPGFGPRQQLIAQFRRRQRSLDLDAAIAELGLLDAQGKGALMGDVWQSLECLLLNLCGANLPTVETHRRLLQRSYG
ncbi:MAG: DNA polymerase III subunit delta [Pseudomonadales bacterium]